MGLQKVRAIVLLQYFGMKEIKELTLSVRTEGGILREPYRTWISGASSRIQLLKNQWIFIIQSKERGLVQSVWLCVANSQAK